MFLPTDGMETELTQVQKELGYSWTRNTQAQKYHNQLTNTEPNTATCSADIKAIAYIFSQPSTPGNNMGQGTVLDEPSG